MRPTARRTEVDSAKMVRLTTVLSPADGAVVVTCRGEIDLSTVGQLAEALDAAMLAAPDSDIVVDFTEVTFFDALTLGTLVDGNNRLACNKRRLIWRGLSAFQRRVARVCGIDQLIVIR